MLIETKTQDLFTPNAEIKDYNAITDNAITMP